MKDINMLLDVIETLLGPNGCPWDREQTLLSMRPLILEETYETIDAINLKDNKQIEEELGDLLFNVLFMCRLAEKEGITTQNDIIKHITNKLIERHPHIFSVPEKPIETSEDVLNQWNKIKNEKRKANSQLDSIPKGLPALARAQKVWKIIKKSNFSPDIKAKTPEDQEGLLLFDKVRDCVQKGHDPEQTLYAYISKLENQFRDWEQNVVS